MEMMRWIRWQVEKPVVLSGFFFGKNQIPAKDRRTGLLDILKGGYR